MASDDFGMFRPTDDWATEWWTWVERIARAVSQASIRIGTAVMSGAFAIAASNMFGRQDGLGKLTLVAAAVFAVWFAVSSALSTAQRR